jgi:hypothetical protein
MPVLLANNATSRLAGSIATTDEQIALNAGDGSRFPSPGTGEWFPLTIINAAGVMEIVHATARSGDVVTVLRGREGTQPAAFAAGDRIELRVTAAVMAEKFDKGGGTITGPVTLTADLTTYRPASPGTGVVFLGNSGSRYLHWDGSNYIMPGGHLYVNGNPVWTSGNFNPANYLPLSGGTISGGFQINSTAPQINLYDTDWGMRYLHCNGGLVGFLTSGGGWACYSQNDGTFIASGNIGAYSDRKHKKRIRPIRGALALIERLRGVRYVDKRTGVQRVGVIAQEVRGELPEVVGEGPDGLHVDYGNIVGPLIEAVKELAAKVRKLEAR